MNLFHRSVKNIYTFKFWLLDLLDWIKSFGGLTGPISWTMILKWADCVWPFLFSYYFLCMYWVPCQFLIQGKWPSRELITTELQSLYSPYRMPREWFTGEMERVKKIRSEYRFKMGGIQFCLAGRVWIHYLPSYLLIRMNFFESTFW